MTPEDLFNMFFGGAFPTGIFIHQYNHQDTVGQPRVALEFVTL